MIPKGWAGTSLCVLYTTGPASTRSVPVGRDATSFLCTVHYRPGQYKECHGRSSWYMFFVYGTSYRPGQYKEWQGTFSTVTKGTRRMYTVQSEWRFRAYVLCFKINFLNFKILEKNSCAPPSHFLYFFQFSHPFSFSVYRLSIYSTDMYHLREIYIFYGKNFILKGL